MASISNGVNECFVYNLSIKDYILRLLVLGTRENKYDQRAKQLSTEDMAYIQAQIKAGHGEEILNIVKEVYKESRAPKFDNTFLVLAMLCKAENPMVKRLSLAALANFRTLSHLYMWKNFHAGILDPVSGEKSKGFGRAVKRELNNWILSYRYKALDLAYQITKYQSREGWSFKNILQCTHVCTKTGDNRLLLNRKNPNPHNVKPTEFDLVLRYAVNGIDAMTDLAWDLPPLSPVCTYLKAVHFAKHCTEENKSDLIHLVYEHTLTREQVPTWSLTDTDVLTALLCNKQKTRITMPLNALLRNLGNMTKNQVFATEKITDIVRLHLTDPSIIKYSHIHPVTVLTAWFTYKKGMGNKGHNQWEPCPDIVAALEEMFYLSFKNVEPTGKRICFLIDSSGSMRDDSLCEGVSNAEAAALLAMIFARSETGEKDRPAHAFYLFTSKNTNYWGHGNTGLTDISDVIDANAPLENVLNAVQRSDWGSTDISMGILEALKYKRQYDAFVVITDNDVNSGIKPAEAMRQYRKGLKLPQSKLVVVATKGTDITIADPADPFMLDMCGFDAHGPKILQDFIKSA
jgi:60 kDa SS-A/Ro ribonucleoprotein